jgi:signal peptidase I
MADEQKEDIFEVKIGEDVDPAAERSQRLSRVMPSTDHEAPKGFRLLLDIVVNIVVVVVLYFIIREYFVAPFRVIGPSMCDTLNLIEEQCEHGSGEYLVLNKATYHSFFGRRFGAPERGDIVVFHPPGDEANFFVKRIIGMPGEIVEVKGGTVRVNGRELPEPYLNEKNQGKTEVLRGGKSRFKIPLDGYFVLGDNRRASVDARNCFADGNLGDCSTGRQFHLTIDNIEGKAWFILLPLENIRVLRPPDYGETTEEK